MEIVIINEDLFKENSPIKEDTVIDKFVPYLSIAQRMYVRKILGVALLEELQEQVKAASVTPAPPTSPITEHNQALLMMIAPVLSFYAVYQGIPFHWASIVNKGITIRESENSKGVDVKDIAQLRRWLKDDAEELGRALVEYLCSCAENYPLWKPGTGYGCGGGGCGDDKKTQDFDTGINIPIRYRR